MTPKYLRYPLYDGFVDHWLVQGPLAAPVGNVDPETTRQADYKGKIVRQFFDPSPGIGEEIIESGYAFVAGSESKWKYYRCREDHRVDIGVNCPNWMHVSVLAYAEIHLSESVRVSLCLTTNSAVDVWVNDQSVFHDENISEQSREFVFPVELHKENKLLVRMRQVGGAACVNWMTVRMMDTGDHLANEVIAIPTKARYPGRFQELEKNLEKAHLEEVVNYKGANFMLRWAEGTADDFHFNYQVQDEQERIYVEGTWQPEASGTDIGHTVRLFERPFRIVLKAPPREYYEMNNRYQRVMPLYVLDTKYADTPTGSLVSRRAEGLKNAAKYESNVYAQIALVASGKLGEVKEEAFREASHATLRGDAGSEVQLLGMLGLALRDSDKAELEVVLKVIRETAAAFTSMPPIASVQMDLEWYELVHQACLVLAGWLTGQQSLAQESEAACAAWIKQKGINGFDAWLSNSDLEPITAALAHLTSLAKETELRELSAVLLDKILFDLAAHTYKGAFASAHGVTDAGMMTSAQMEATSGITRMVYGMGVYNPHITGLVSLAVSDYEFPSFFAEIAKDARDEMLSKENIGGVSVVTYRTPDYMLSSAQDWRSGQRGKSELVWQATFGPDSLVYTSHPDRMSSSAAHQPGFWLGNGVMPRVAQWKDVLIAVYNTNDDGMNFTHAHFPVYQFDEYTLKDGWAFARKGSGYLAITAARGIELTKKGAEGYRELRSYGSPNIWICHMGRETQDGSFADFQEKILAIRLDWPENSAKVTSLRGEEIVFGWEGCLTVDGIEQDLVFKKAMENPYCKADIGSTVYEISWGEITMRLNFE